MAPLLIGVFFLGSMQLFFIGFLGEYVLSINTRVLDRPLVVEELRLNFDEPKQKPEETMEEAAVTTEPEKGNEKVTQEQS